MLNRNRAKGIAPKSESGMSLIISNDRAMVSKLRKGTRKVSPLMIYQAGKAFGLDYNIFFEENPLTDEDVEAYICNPGVQSIAALQKGLMEIMEKQVGILSNMAKNT